MAGHWAGVDQCQGLPLPGVANQFTCAHHCPRHYPGLAAESYRANGSRGGFLVGLCTFPCSGGIYVAIVGLLSTRTTYFQGLGYLSLYNLMFVMPLVIILALATDRRVLHRLRLAQQSQSRRLRLLSGLLMIATGVVILLWFV
ncbi:MAG: hypothetical protein FJ014_13865 [Chloroflexi bacterium]|nr:hypothetical protein [Chloroflexota bacterium]